jgi:hypothetical protein
VRVLNIVDQRGNITLLELFFRDVTGEHHTLDYPV